LIQSFYIAGERLEIDPIKTKEFYLTQHKITDDCQCDDCHFYAVVFIQKKFSFFELLKTMGIDLRKNLTGEPTGVWCVRDDQGGFLYCQHVYQAIGQFSNTNTERFRYNMAEGDYKILAEIVKKIEGKIDFELIIEKV